MSPVSFSIIGPRGSVGAAIRSGDTVVLRVVRHLAGSNWQVTYRGELLSIKSTVDLKVGARIRTKAEISGNRVMLRLIPEPGQEAGVSRRLLTGGPFTAERSTEVLIQAFRRAGLRIDTGIFRKAREVLEKTKRGSRTVAGVLAALAEKNITPEPGTVDYISGLLDTFAENQGETPQRQPQQKKNNENQVDLESLVNQLKLQVETPASREGPIHLFNHISGSDESWILIPYVLRQEVGEVSGVIRLRVERNGKIRRIAMDASVENVTYAFSFGWPMDENDVIKVGCTDQHSLKEYINRSSELPEKLRNLDSILDDNSIEEGLLDGLALESVSSFERFDKLV